MGMSMSEGCKRNIESGVISDVEHKTQVIIEDMGGRMRPGQELTEEERRVYSTVLTGSGETEMLQLNTGMIERPMEDYVRHRIGDL
jgi:phosphatidylinositol-4,5-bisphosphate 4-phosphatase